MPYLVIVESPTKAKTISRFLDKNFHVESSFGHIRDLPKSKMGIDIEKDFAPHYVVPRTKQKIVTKLKKLAQKADMVYFATDEDREGEAISWHLAHVLQTPDEKNKRIAFHEITKEALQEALKKPRHIDLNLVNAQQARRLLDRLVGYELSPFLWRKVAKGLSAGRVQSVAVRLIAEREREIERFTSQEYWYVIAQCREKKGGKIFEAKLHKIDGTTLTKFHFTAKDQVDAVVASLKKASFTVARVDKKQSRRNPLPPFTTSTLQQEANRRFGLSAKHTMAIAQRLYEGMPVGSQGQIGLITYMRTDSVNLAEKFLNEAHTFIKKAYGAPFVEKRRYKTKSKGAQEAHEAIRPTNVTLTPADVKDYLDPRQHKLYTLIWQRAVASQMAPALINTMSVDIAADNCLFRATGNHVSFEGFLKIYPMKITESELPPLAKGDAIAADNIKGEQKFTQPPARYSEAGLVRVLEQKGIGRPSTYAPTIATIQERNYVIKEEKRLKPTEIGILVNDLLVEHFPEIVNYNFTAHMEKELDDIAEGERKWPEVIAEFYHPFKKRLLEKDSSLSKKEITEEKSDETCEKCKSSMVIKMGRYGKFLACSNYPECKNTKNIDADNKPVKSKTLEETCPECENPLEYKHGRFGTFIGCSHYPQCTYIKNIEKGTGAACPSCAKGEIVEKRSKRGRTFYACNQYPGCTFALWSKPTGKQCPQCEHLLVYGAKDTVRCSNKECGYTEKNSS